VAAHDLSLLVQRFKMLLSPPSSRELSCAPVRAAISTIYYSKYSVSRLEIMVFLRRLLANHIRPLRYLRTLRSHCFLREARLPWKFALGSNQHLVQAPAAKQAKLAYNDLTAPSLVSQIYPLLQYKSDARISPYNLILFSQLDSFAMSSSRHRPQFQKATDKLQSFFSGGASLPGMPDHDYLEIWMFSLNYIIYVYRPISKSRKLRSIELAKLISFGKGLSNEKAACKHFNK
jgi:hypothetical protein